jgi:glycosyltransferase involved in cell wall biosynthesis
MKIVIATPFYPPDTEPVAVYAKKLAEMLAQRHDVTVVSYVRLPEEMNDVKIFTVNKEQPLFFRLVKFAFFLFRATKKTDILYAENGPSVEVPLWILSLFTGRPFVLHIGDPVADARSQNNFFLGKIHRFLEKRAQAVVNDIPLRRPEIIPFQPEPIEEQAMYRASWDAHVKKLLEIFKLQIERNGNSERK